MKKNILFIILLLSLSVDSCIIESYPYLDFLKPMNYSDSISYHGEKIEGVVYKNENNNFTLSMDCLKSIGDTIDYYEIELAINNYSKDSMKINLSDFQMYTEDYFLKPDKYTEMLVIVGAYPTIYNKVKNVTFTDSLKYYIRFLFDKKTKVYKNELKEKKADVVVTNIHLEKKNKQINIPKFYFKE